MLIARFAILIPSLAIAGVWLLKKMLPLRLALLQQTRLFSAFCY